MTGFRLGAGQWWIVVAAILILAAVISLLNRAETPAVIAGTADVRDGDSLVIGRHRARLSGIDAPERDQKCSKHGEEWPCGRAARRHLAGLIANRGVKCTVEKRDRFQRLLVYCRVGERDLNRRMVRDGMAVSFGRRYWREEATARKAGLGLWAGTFQRPQLWRKQNPRR